MLVYMFLNLKGRIDGRIGFVPDVVALDEAARGEATLLRDNS